MEKCYSIDEECFNLNNIGEVIEQIENDLNEDETPLGRYYWEDDAIPFTHSDIVSPSIVGYFLESLDESLGDEVVEFDCLYSDVSHEEKKILTDLIKDWAEKYVNIGRYYRITNVQEKTIEADDL